MLPIGYPQAIKSLAPGAEWSMTDITDYSTLVWSSPSITKPTEQALQDEVVRLEAQEPFNVCKAEAKKRIASTDWAVLPDVGLANVAEFETYRASLRALIKNPVQDPVFGTEPDAVWS